MKIIRGKILAISQPFVVASERRVDEDDNLILMHTNRINVQVHEAGVFGIESSNESFDLFSTLKVGDMVSFEAEKNVVLERISVLR